MTLAYSQEVSQFHSAQSPLVFQSPSPSPPVRPASAADSSADLEATWDFLRGGLEAMDDAKKRMRSAQEVRDTGRRGAGAGQGGRPALCGAADPPCCEP